MIHLKCHDFKKNTVFDHFFMKKYTLYPDPRMHFLDPGGKSAKNSGFWRFLAKTAKNGHFWESGLLRSLDLSLLHGSQNMRIRT